MKTLFIEIAIFFLKAAAAIRIFWKNSSNQAALGMGLFWIVMGLALLIAAGYEQKTEQEGIDYITGALLIIVGLAFIAYSRPSPSTPE